MAMGVTNCSTVPRKRRPRAIGEVFISSQSAVYLTDPKEPRQIEPILDESEPFYQNTNSLKTPKSPTQQLLANFNSCRTSERETDESAKESDTGWETQRVSVYIGENKFFFLFYWYVLYIPPLMKYHIRDVVVIGAFYEIEFIEFIFHCISVCI